MERTEAKLNFIWKEMQDLAENDKEKSDLKR